VAVGEPGQRGARRHAGPDDDGPRTAPAEVPGGLGPGGQWALTLLPGFPIILLVLRLWQLSRQDVPTMLLMVQHVSPLGLVSSLVISLMWVPPVVILAVRVLGGLLVASTPDDPDQERSWLVRRSNRLPGWVVLVAAMWAALSWQLRFLPTLATVCLAILGLTVRYRFPDNRVRAIQVCLVLPAVIAVVEYLWFGPAIVAAFAKHEVMTAVLLLVPPVLAPLVTGPVPAVAARAVTHWPASVAAFLAPIVMGVIFLRTPVLPLVALEVGDPAPAAEQIMRGQLVDVDDHMTMLLDNDGVIRFIHNERVRDTTLCAGSEQIPYSVIDVRGWHTERSALQWLLPNRTPTPDDPRCDGRLPARIN
jgi:hypothetical protein